MKGWLTRGKSKHSCLLMAVCPEEPRKKKKEISKSVHMVSVGGGPWSGLTRAIKVYKHEAHLSIMLTGCPHPTPLASERQETPEQPDPALRAGLGHSWYEEGLAAVAWKWIFFLGGG